MDQLDGSATPQHRCNQLGCNAAFPRVWNLKRHLRQAHDILQYSRQHDNLRATSTSRSPTPTSPGPSLLPNQLSVIPMKGNTLESTPNSTVAKSPTPTQISQAPSEVPIQPSISSIEGNTVEPLVSSSISNVAADIVLDTSIPMTQAPPVLAPPSILPSEGNTAASPIPVSSTANNVPETADLFDSVDPSNITDPFRSDEFLSGPHIFDDFLTTTGGVHCHDRSATNPIQTPHPCSSMSSRDSTPALDPNQANPNQTFQPWSNVEPFTQTPQSCPTVPLGAINGSFQSNHVQAWSNIAMDALQIPRSCPNFSSRNSTPYSDTDPSLHPDHIQTSYPWSNITQTREDWPDFLSNADINPRSVPAYLQETAIPVPRARGNIDQLSLTNPTPESTDIDSTDDDGCFSNLEEEMSAHQSQRATGRKRKRSPANYRINRARQALPLPKYRGIESEMEPGQIQAIDWLRPKAKLQFDRELEVLIVRWGGVKPTHRGTCVLCPGSWASLKPADLGDIDDPEQLPTAQSEGMVFQFSDYSTSLERAAGWFQSEHWPHSGFDLDMFVGCDIDGPVDDASHLCHQEHCMVHITFESSEIKQDRQKCAEAAKQARSEQKDIPASCSRHDPPCLLQVRTPPSSSQHY